MAPYRLTKRLMPFGPIGASARQRNAGRRPYGGSSAAGGCWRTQSHSRRTNKNSPKHAGREIVLRERSNTCSARFCTGNSSRIALAALLAWTTIVDPIIAQTSQPPDAAQSPAKAPQSAVYSLTDLEYLLGPIALYPDPLLALILPASTFPLQIVQADRWLASNSAAAKRGEPQPGATSQ